MTRITDQIAEAYERNIAADAIRSEFLNDLDDADHIDLTDWEAKFMETNISRTSFSEKQRTVIDRMRAKYEDRL